MLQDLFKGAPSDALLTTGHRPLQSGENTEKYLFVLLKASSIPGDFSQEFPPSDTDVLSFLNKVCKNRKTLHANKVCFYLALWLE